MKYLLSPLFISLCVLCKAQFCWQQVGAGSNALHHPIADYQAITTDVHGNVYVAISGGIAVWDGLTWNTTQNDTTFFLTSPLAKDGFGNVYATYKGTAIAKWDGLNWSLSTVDSNVLNVPPTGNSRNILAISADDSGNVYATFDTGSVPCVGDPYGCPAATLIDKWNGNSWSTIGRNVGGDINGLTCDRAGNVYTIKDTTSYYNDITTIVNKWNGSHWSTIWTGFGCSNPVMLTTDTYGNLYIAGDSADNMFIYKWIGSNLVELLPPSGTQNLGVYGIAADDSGNLYTSLWGGGSYGVYKWNGTTIQYLGDHAGFCNYTTFAFGPYGSSGVTQVALDNCGNVYCTGMGPVPGSDTGSCFIEVYGNIRCSVAGISPVSNNVALIAWPNPFSNDFNIAVPVNSSGVGVLSINDALGIVVYKSNYDLHNEKISVLETGWSPGVYFYELQIAGGLIYRGKVVKQ